MVVKSEFDSVVEIADVDEYELLIGVAVISIVVFDVVIT